MNFFLFLKGLLVGFAIAAPVGPVNVLCIRRTLTEGRLSGFISGLGAATADTLYGCIAGFGLTFISNLLIRQQIWLRLIGGIFLIYLGIITFRSRPISQEAPVKGYGFLGAYLSTFFLTLTNPITILAFMALFAGVGVDNISGDSMATGILIGGVFLGSSLWWILLSSGVRILQAKFTLAGIHWINKISGVLITGFGVLALLSIKR